MCIYTCSSLLGDAQKSSKAISGLYYFWNIFIECQFLILMSVFMKLGLTVYPSLVQI